MLSQKKKFKLNTISILFAITKKKKSFNGFNRFFCFSILYFAELLKAIATFKTIKQDIFYETMKLIKYIRFNKQSPNKMSMLWRHL